MKRLALDVAVGLLFLSALLLITLMPPDSGSRVKRLAWDTVEVLFQVGVTAVVLLLAGYTFARIAWEEMRAKRKGSA